MIYIIDTSSFRELERYYQSIFVTFWTLFQDAVDSGEVVSVSEVWRELGACPETNVIEWGKNNPSICRRPTSEETEFVGHIFTVPHFSQLISAKAQTTGQPVADPFLIAAAKIYGGTVVTEERFKPNAAKIPNVCAHFGIECTNLQGFLQAKGWSF
ncbi:PIN domain-containing protein [Ancylobacter sp.]|uniref:PIN domain-containing protein n=1 Tax=Ancylobacter sp. TaxID=1872567 RepID=UPI003D0B1541